MKRVFSIIGIMCASLVIMFGTVMAAPIKSDNPELLEQMERNPSNFRLLISTGGGLGAYYDKSSIKVEWRNETETVISYNGFGRDANDPRGIWHFYVLKKPKKVAYNHIQKVIYECRKDKAGNEIWEYVPRAVVRDGSAVDIRMNHYYAEMEYIYYFATGEKFYEDSLLDYSK